MFVLHGYDDDEVHSHLERARVKRCFAARMWACVLCVVSKYIAVRCKFYQYNHLLLCVRVCYSSCPHMGNTCVSRFFRLRVVRGVAHARTSANRPPRTNWMHDLSLNSARGPGERVSRTLWFYGLISPH